MFVLTHPAAFDEFSKLPPPLFPAAAKIMKLSNAYVVFNDAQKVTGFNWGGFKDAVVAHPGTDLAFDKLQSTSITNQTASVDDMSSKIAQFLVDTFALKSNNQDGLKAQINSAFNNLDKKESSGWFSSYKNEGHGSSWEYRIVFALPNPDHADWFYSVVSTIKYVEFPSFIRGFTDGRVWMIGSPRTSLRLRVGSG